MSDIRTKFRDRLLDRFESEADQIGKLMDQLADEMSAVPPGERSGERWDSFTTQFADLTAKHQRLGERLNLVGGPAKQQK